MKAWFVFGGDDWGDYVHGDNVSAAKSMFWDEWGMEVDEWIRMRPVRCKRLDDIPITAENIGEPWFPICSCKICTTNPEARIN